MIYQPILDLCCYRCHQWFPHTSEFFNRHKKEKSGLRKICKSCHRADTKLYFKDHPDKKRDGNRLYGQRHPEKIRERSIRYEMRHPERVKMLRRASYLRNIEKRREQTRRWHKANPDKVKVIKHRRYAREMKAEGHFSVDDILAQYKHQKGKCYWCGKKVGKNYHIDHVIPLTRGGTNWPSNIVIACPYCNESKHNKLPHEWPGNGGKML